MAHVKNADLMKENEALKAQVAALADANKSLAATEKKLRKKLKSAVDDAQGWEEGYRRWAESHKAMDAEHGKLTRELSEVREEIEHFQRNIAFEKIAGNAVIAGLEAEIKALRSGTAQIFGLTIAPNDT